MKNSVRLWYFIPLGLFLLLVILTPSVLAMGKPTDVGKKTTGVQEEKRLQSQNRLTEAKLRACQAKETSITKRMGQLEKLVTNMQAKFSAIEGRVEEYYTSKMVPSGKTVANYNNLVADIQTKKGAVQTALTQTQSDAATFTCSGDDPKGQLAQFRNDMRAVKSTLKDYRTSIKNLIVAVRSVTGSSPKPTKTGGGNE